MTGNHGSASASGASGRTVPGRPWGSAAVLAELEARIPGIAAETVRRIESTIPAFERAGRPLLRTVHTVACETFAVMIGVWRTGRPATKEELERLSEIGLPPAGTGISLEDTLHAYRLGCEAIFEHFRDVAQQTPGVDPGFVLAAAPVGYRFHNDVCTALTRRRVTTDRRLVRRREDVERSLVEHLVAPEPRLEQAARFARSLDVPLSGSWRVGVARPGEDAADAADGLTRLAMAARRRVGPGERGLVAVVEGWVVIAVGTERSAPDLPPSGLQETIGIGGAHPGARGIRASFEEARIALQIALRRGASRLCFDDIWLDRLFLGSVSVAELAAAVLRPLDDLPDQRRRAWLETLRAWFDGGRSVTNAARLLHMHPQSVRYRLAQIEQLFGSRFHAPDHLLALHLAVTSQRTLGDHRARGDGDLSDVLEGA